MKAKILGLLLMTLLAAACGRQQTNSDGNGTGNADGVGGRADPPSVPATDSGVPPANTDSESAPAQSPQNQSQQDQPQQ